MTLSFEEGANVTGWENGLGDRNGCMRDKGAAMVVIVERDIDSGRDGERIKAGWGAEGGVV